MSPNRVTNTVLVAMSGGVDSSVAAAVLRDEGHEVVGVTMKLWGGDSDTGCCSVADVDDARRVAQQLGIDHLVFNFTDDFQADVVAPYVESHRTGRTPNPCVECNRHLKFDRLLHRARLLGFDKVATGHHCRIVLGEDGLRRVGRGRDRAKDQSYVVHMLANDRLADIAFPVGAMSKDDVRREAARRALRTASKPDSQDVCFITAAGRESFLGARIALRPGQVVDGQGRELGTVPATELVTVGQRRGLGLPGGGPPLFATAVDIDTATITVGPADALLATSLALDDLVWHGCPESDRVLVQVSAHGVPRRAHIDGDVVRWSEPERIVAPGQSVVIYDASDKVVLGSGLAR